MEEVSIHVNKSRNQTVSFNMIDILLNLNFRFNVGIVRAVRVFLDGKLVDTASSGSDPVRGAVTVNSDRLYELVDLKGNHGTHLLRLEFSPGIEVFAFTFG